MKNRRLLCGALGCVLAFCVQVGAQENGSWRAASTTAKSITGDIAFSGERITINFATYLAAQIRALKPEELSAAFDLGGEVNGRGNLYRVSIPGAKQFLHRNKLCGSEDTQWIVTYGLVKACSLRSFRGRVCRC
jgi:hypothetical protein